MENHTTKSKIKLMKFLPKVANAVVSFQNPPFSPCRDKLKSHFNNRGFSGPMMIPIEARRKSRNNFESEPTSPKISCIGQIKHKKKTKKQQSSSNNSVSSKDLIKIVEIKPDQEKKNKNKKKTLKSSSFKNILSFGRRSSDADRVKSNGSERAAPSLGQMRRFASSRDAFANFDWTTTHAQIAPQDDDDDDDDDEDFRVHHSAPNLRDLEPRKEINLWKRRTMAKKPKPLELNVVKKL